jgi:hypothetical protein
MGTATKDVIVAANGSLYLYGTIGGDLRVETGGKAFVDGTVVGAVINDGGLVKIEGSVGDVVDRSGTTQVSPKPQAPSPKSTVNRTRVGRVANQLLDSCG